MPRQDVPILGFNGGVIGKAALARTDLERVRVSCEQMNNLVPRVIGEMSTRPGTTYIGSVKSDAIERLVPFVYSASAKALIELTNGVMRVWVSDALVTRVSVATAITNGAFNADVASWNDDDEAGATSDWDGVGAMRLLGTDTSYARRNQLVTVAGGDIGKEHALRVVVTRGPVKIRVGTTAANATYMAETVLRTGRHSLSFTPAGNFYVAVYSNDDVYRLIDSIEIEAAGAMELVSPWDATDIRALRYDQSADVIFCAVAGTKKQQRIERHSFTAWSICDYDANDGPFMGPNLDAGVTITPSAVSGNVTFTASQNLFASGHVGGVFQLTHSGQTQTVNLTGANQFGSPIRVTGIASGPGVVGSRSFVVDISGTFVATVTLQRSIGAPGSWSDIGTSTAPSVSTYNDTLDNQIVYYRLGIKIGDYTSGTAVGVLTYDSSQQTGSARITGFTDAKTVAAEVVTTLGKAVATSDWREGFWSGYRGFPGAVAIDDGRLWWGKKDSVFGSISDAYESYDQSFEGDAGPIIRSIAVGPVEGLYWLLAMQRLIAGSSSQEVSIRSSSFDEPLTPTKFTARRSSSRGSANVAAIAVDTTAVFVQRDGKRVFEMAYNVEAQDYVSRDLTRLNPRICAAGVNVLAVQRQPDTRIWAVLGDGTVAILLYERGEGVLGWHTLDTDGIVEDVAVLPGADEDDVYLVVRRTINAVTKRYLEKFAKEREVRCATVNKAADAHIVWAGGATSTVTGLSHLEAKQVVVWYNGAAVNDQSNMATVTGGQITTASAVNAGAVIGLPYTSRWKSMKLAFAASAGTALEQRKRVDHLGLLMTETAWKGVKLGRDFSNLRAMPKMYRGVTVADSKVFDDYDFDMASFNGGFDTDARVCIEVKAPYSATFQGLVVGMVTNDKDAPSKEAA